MRHGAEARVCDLSRGNFPAVCGLGGHLLAEGWSPIVQAVPYLLGGAAGGVLAGKLFGRVKADWLRRAFGVLILYGGIRAVLLL